LKDTKKRPHYVRHGDDSGDFSVRGDRESTNLVLQHQARGSFHGIVWPGRDDLGPHHSINSRALQIAGMSANITFGENADNVTPVNHCQAPETAGVHQALCHRQSIA
jgi:hypothetical protein